ncbi:rhomboid family intramembrane serine protease [Candidatus Bathyarchaeota archaeon]|nr:rhomboid family intramembrane serine protease [Candidatus Bathyarchaeota archaeon]
MFKFKRSFGIPMGGYTRTKTWPVATLALIIVNIAVYAITSYENFFLEIGDYWVGVGGFVPSLIVMPAQLYRIFSSMFLHADFFHILFNMYFLYLFGRAVEEALGKWRFLALYILSGVAASIFHTAFSFLGGATAYAIPAIGASGAISGVLGAYLILFPGTSLVMGWAFLFFPVFFRMKAAYYLIFWFATQVIYGYTRLGGSTAVFAHAGGFIAGIALLPLVASKERLFQFRLARQALFPVYVTFAPSPAPVKSVGLGRTTKTVVAVLLASLLFGAAYASSGLSIHGEIKSATIRYSFEGTPYMDYVGFQLADIESQLAKVSSSETKILLYRLYGAGLLYNKTMANEDVKISNWNVSLSVRVGGRPFLVDLAIIRFDGEYDADGFLSYGAGAFDTQVIFVDYYDRPYVSDFMVHYDFEWTSQTVNLTYITQLTGILSLVATAAALVVTLKKDRNLTLIGEEPERLWSPFTPYI